MYKLYFKRILDIICALATIIVFSWLYIILAVLVKWKLGSPVIFTQERPGKDEKIFTLYKFRSMNDKKDAKGELLPDSVRLTRFGKLLRKTSLDELPEVFNILKGDMSFVGPRPLLCRYLPLYSEFQRRRHEVTPGLTGLAQINGRNSIAWEEKFRLDIEYVDNISFIGDVKIILMTFWKAFVKAEGISQEGEATMEFFMGNENKTEVLK